MANPGANRHRLFSEEDLEVFSLVSEFKNQGKTYTDIHFALKTGQRGDPPTLLPDEVQAIMVSDQEKRLALEVDYLQRALVRTQNELDEARKQIAALHESEKENIRLKEAMSHSQQRLDLQDTYAQQRIRELEKQLQESKEWIGKLTEQRANLEREVGQAYAKGVIEALERKGDFPQIKHNQSESD
jgi:DNA-binding transcriptional MerR regulator